MHEGEREEENHRYRNEKDPVRVLMNPAERFWARKGEEIVRSKLQIKRSYQQGVDVNEKIAPEDRSP